jgi:hypothetical protein
LTVDLDVDVRGSRSVWETTVNNGRTSPIGNPAALSGVYLVAPQQ